MACFIVPVTEAVVTTIVGKVIKTKEEKLSLESEDYKIALESKIPMSKKISWLNTMLWGGSALLAFEHVWHGEVTPFFPFITAMGNAEDTVRMLYEMSTVGIAMSILVTAVWGVMCLVSASFENASEEDLLNTEKEQTK